MNLASTTLGRIPTYRLDYQLRPNHVAQEGYDRVYLHNTVKHADLDNLLRYSFSRGFAGIGYHFAIDPQGIIYETRPLNVMGAHVYGRNNGSIGIAFLNINVCVESERSKKSYKALIKELDVPVFSHTYGQFEYINQLLERRGLPLIELSERVSDPEVFYSLKEKLTQTPSLNGDLIRAINQLKLCPGPKVFEVLKW